MTRPPVLRLHSDELVVDNFAGGGGASTGLGWALGRSPDIAINHDAEALAMHAANHPTTRHLREDVFDVNPARVCEGRRVALAWFSPDCTYFSKSRGGKPFRDRDKARRRRGLAWVVVKWAKAVKPRVILLENVEEFEDWGPLGDDGLPDPKQRGFTFRRWLAQLEGAGYRVEWRQLRACDFGAPTIRKRLFIVARCDGHPIVWPEKTHGPGRAQPHRVAAECIDWSLPCPSIFLSPVEARVLKVRRPLAEPTMRRIARGVMRHVIEAASPFVVSFYGEGAGGLDRSGSLEQPLSTVTTARRHALISPTLIQTGQGERPGQAPRVPGLDKPLGTVVACGGRHALVAAFLARHYGGHENDGARLDASIPTVTCRDHHALVTSHLVRAEEARVRDVRAFLIKYYGCEQQAPQLDLPMHTVTTKDRFALVTVAGEEYVIADIGMRMLTPRELFRAHGFEDSYVIDPVAAGRKLTRTKQIEKCGNSVCPPVAAALARAQLEERLQERAA
jgi:DNA (cytosine-5)-methyltransferase 1